MTKLIWTHQPTILAQKVSVWAKMFTLCPELCLYSAHVRYTMPLTLGINVLNESFIFTEVSVQ